MSRIYLIRHGETAWNKAKIFRGRTDIPLNEKGRLEAACAAKALREAAFSRICSSPLARARATAEIIAGSARAASLVVTDEAFTDIDYGKWTGLRETEVRRKFPKLYRMWKDSPHLVKFPRGESLADVRRRAAPRLIELAEQHLRQTFAVVSHRVVLKLLLCEAKGLDDSHFWDMKLDTGAFSVLEYKASHGRRKLRVVVENDTSHLDALKGRIARDF